MRFQMGFAVYKTIILSQFTGTYLDTPNVQLTFDTLIAVSQQRRTLSESQARHLIRDSTGPKPVVLKTTPYSVGALK